MKNIFKLLLTGGLFIWSLSSVHPQNPKSSRFHHLLAINKMMGTLLNCHKDYNSIIIDADSDQSTIELIRTSKLASIAMISNSTMLNATGKLRKEIPLFLMTFNSANEFQKKLFTFKHSPWFNIQSPFFILDKSNQNCVNARNILRKVWKLDVIKSFFLCINSKQIPMIYTYNPFTNRAPSPWKEVSRSIKKSDGWTLYAASMFEGNTCESFNFDRTKYLDGSILRTVVNLPESSSWIPDKDYNNSLIEMMYPADIFIGKIIERALNITFVFNAAESRLEMANKLEDFELRLRNKSSDFAMCLRTRHATQKFSITYPLLYSTYHIIANNRGFYTPFEKIQNFYGLVTLISLCIILAITYTVIVLSGKKRRWSFAGFEILRLLVNAALHSDIKTLARKIFFAVILLYFLIIQATLSGNLSAFLTKDQYRSNVERLEDLKDSRYDVIYANPSIANLISDPVLKQKLNTEYAHCGPLIIGNDAAACIDDIFMIMNITMDNQLHMAEDPIGVSVYVYSTRQNWPLKEKFEMFMMSLEQGGIFRQYQKNFMNALAERRQRILTEKAGRVRPIALWMIEVPLYILAFGLTLATVVFIMELKIKGIQRGKKINLRLKRRIFFHLRR